MVRLGLAINSHLSDMNYLSGEELRFRTNLVKQIIMSAGDEGINLKDDVTYDWLDDQVEKVEGFMNSVGV